MMIVGVGVGVRRGQILTQAKKTWRFCTSVKMECLHNLH